MGGHDDSAPPPPMPPSLPPRSPGAPPPYASPGAVSSYGPGAYGTPSWSTFRGPTGPPSGPPPQRGRAATVAILALVALFIAAGVTVAVVGGDLELSPAETSTKAEGTQTSAVTTIPERVTNVGLLNGYCNLPGATWPEVPRHVPGEPVRMQVSYVSGSEQVNGYDDIASELRPSRNGGSTVISPVTDGKLTSEPLVLARTRAVACIQHVATEGTGVSCDYGQFEFTVDFSVELARSRYEVIVYELHSGGILHRGEIWSDASDCPDKARDVGSGQVTMGIDDTDVLSWVSSHFVDGKPA